MLFLTVNTSAKHIRLKLSPALCSALQPRFPPQPPPREGKKILKKQENSTNTKISAVRSFGGILGTQWGMATPILLLYPMGIPLDPGGAGDGKGEVPPPSKKCEIAPKKWCWTPSGLSPWHLHGQKGLFGGLFSPLLFLSVFRLQLKIPGRI